MSNPIVAVSDVKRCTKCGVGKPVSEFHKNVQSKDGLKYVCIACVATYYAVYYAENRQKKAAYHADHRQKKADYNAAYYAKHRQKIAARDAAYRADHKAEKAAYRADHKAEKAVYNAAYHAEHRQGIATRKAAYHAEHRQEIAARDAANPEARRAKRHRYRAKKRNAPGTYTVAQIKDLLLKQKCKCVYCKINIRKGYHVDHIIALAKGGSNYIYNLQLLCPSCNYSKSARDPIEFSQEKGMLL